MTEPRQKQELELPHRLTLDARSRLSMTGVLEVESFDENAIVLATTRGTLIVRGTGLHLQMLSLEGGQVGVDGSIALHVIRPDTASTAHTPMPLPLPGTISPEAIWIGSV